MFRITALTAAAPLVLLAACGESTPVEETQVAPMDTGVAEVDRAAGDLPEVPENALSQIAFGGAYVREGASGPERIVLDSSDDSWEFLIAGESVSSGSFTRMEDNRRIELDDFDGAPAYFAVAEGVIYRLDTLETPPSEISVAGQYRRAESEPEAEPEADAAESGAATAEAEQPDQAGDAATGEADADAPPAEPAG